MNVVINLAEKESTIEVLQKLMEKEYVPFDIEITNSHIKDINNITGYKLFTKKSLYVSSSTLYELMQPLGGKGQHNYHALTPEDVFMALDSIKDPMYVIFVKDKRYAMISVKLSHFHIPLMLIVETEASLITNNNANINKVVTIYPKSHIEEFINKLDKEALIYKNPQMRVR